MSTSSSTTTTPVPVPLTTPPTPTPTTPGGGGGGGGGSSSENGGGGAGGGGGGAVVRSPSSSSTSTSSSSKMESLKTWSISTYKCTKQLISEKLGKSSRTVDTELETQIESLRDTQRKYSHILRLARALSSHFYHVVQRES
ncbi:arfaptin-2-like [Penaeus japonicus]|uniref:arfaptin-2-like n=1 Tax=Penaeus japonicus TaxID=27405 RepID=UPI001C70BC69|nr:arfaptin-2-like [Penaeus japonicus]